MPLDPEPSRPPALLIVGAGNAGAELAVAARQQGWAGAITLLGDEPHLPYHRPPLSKAYLAGSAPADTLTIRQQAAYDKALVSVRTGVKVQRIAPAARCVVLDDGSTLAYDKLALCTGGSARLLRVDGLAEGAAPNNLFYLRRREHSDAMRAALLPGTRLVVIGGGYIGLEVAASARKLGAEVTVLEALPRVLARVTGPQLSAFYESVHREAGVDVRAGVAVVRVDCADDGRVTAVVCADGSRIPADVLVVGVGMLPNVALAEAAGLVVDGGIVVDALCTTSDPDIFAAGDCTVHDNLAYGRRIRLESVPNALEQARVVAATLCGKPRAAPAAPWFWSDQYALKLQMVGLCEGFDEFVLRGDMAQRSFIGFYLRRGQLIAADAVNRPAEFMVAKRLVGEGLAVTAAALADEAVPLKQLLPAPPAAPASA